MKPILRSSRLHTKRLSIIALPLLLLPASCGNAKPGTGSRVRSAKSTAAARAGALQLKRHAFPDVTMGVPEAYTVLLPKGWSAQGQVKWQPVGEAPFPQQEFSIKSPQKGEINYDPMLTFTYTQSDLMGTQGVAPPTNFPQWLVETVDKAEESISNARLISSRRDTKAEAFMKKLERDTGGLGGMEREVYVIICEYDEAKVRRRMETNVTYVRFAPYQVQGMYSQMWSISSAGAISAPVSNFAAQRATLLKVAGTLRPTPHWYTHSQALIAELSRQRAANNWEIIRQRGRQISEMSDAQYAKYKKDMSRSDDAQRQRINAIYETDDFKDTNGKIVNLPMHYNHVFSDGKGNYVLSNNSQDKPGAGWRTIRPYK